MTLTGAATALAAAGAFLATPAHADMASALSLCLDTKLDIPARAAAFERQGWSRESDESQLRDIFAAGAILGTLDALEPSRWSESRAAAERRSQELVHQSRSGGAIVLRSPFFHAAIVLQTNLVGLQTCLYVGNDPGLGPVAEILDGSILREIGSVQRIRGDGPKSLINAHFLGDAGRELFDPPLRYRATFSIVLDRQPEDLQ